MQPIAVTQTRHVSVEAPRVGMVKQTVLVDNSNNNKLLAENQRLISELNKTVSLHQRVQELQTLLNTHTLKVKEQEDIIKLLVATIDRVWKLVLSKSYSHIEIKQDTERVCQIFTELRTAHQRLIEMQSHTHTSTVTEAFKSEIIRILLNKKSAEKSFSTIPDAEIFKKLQETLTSRSELERELINRNREITRLKEELAKGAGTGASNFTVVIQEKEKIIIEMTREIEILRRTLTDERTLSAELKKNDPRDILSKFKSEH